MHETRCDEIINLGSVDVAQTQGHYAGMCLHYCGKTTSALSSRVDSRVELDRTLIILSNSRSSRVEYMGVKGAPLLGFGEAFDVHHRVSF